MPSREPGRSPRQVFGGMLRYYRDQAGLSRTELARQISKSVSLVQAIELGQRAATPDVTDDLEAALATGGALSRLRAEIGDGLGYQVFPAWFQDWAIKEAEAAISGGRSLSFRLTRARASSRSACGRSHLLSATSVAQPPCIASAPIRRSSAVIPS